MKISKLIASAAAGASLLALVGTASAAQIDINIYGASAQFLYWSTAAPYILNSNGCTSIGQAAIDNKNFIAKGTCNSGADTVYIRVSSKASYDGIFALKGESTDPNRVTECEGAGNPGPNFRKMADEKSCTFTSWTVGAAVPTTGCTAGSATCKRVTVAASDVAGKSFTQNSSGQLKGPLGGGLTNRAFNSIDTSTLTENNPLIVPFAFFVNNSVKNQTGGSTLTNLSRSEVMQIFAGQAYNWSDLGYNNGLPIVACLRHAGSGTHSTLEYAVMEGGKWGLSVMNAESTGGPTAYFNDGSGDELNCVAGSGSWSGSGAVGYMDADQTPGTTMTRVAYNGVTPSYKTIANGNYDFWTVERFYTNPATAGLQGGYNATWINNILGFAADPTNWTLMPSAKRDVWAAYCEMNYMKATDQDYPSYQGASCSR